MSSLDPGSKKTIQRYYMKMKYQERQFLRAQDFQDEQDYHVQKMKDHNRLLHTRGVCEGLLVTASKTELCVDVSAGSAIDAIGNPIMLAEKETVDLSKSCPGATSIVLTIRYGQANAPDKEYNPDEGGFSGCTRTLERPIFEAWPAASPSTDANCLLLAAITRNTAGTILTCNSSPLGRLTAGVQLSAVGSGELLPQSVTTDKIKDGAVTEIKLANDAATTAKIKDANITAAKLAVNAVITDKINTAAVTDTKLATDAVITTKIKDANVTAAKLAANAVTADKISATAVTDAKLATDAVTTVKIKDANVTAAKLATNAVTTEKINAAAVTEAKLATDAVTTTKIKDSNVTTAKIASKAVSFDKIRFTVSSYTYTLSPRETYTTFMRFTEEQTTNLLFQYRIWVNTVGGQASFTEYSTKTTESSPYNQYIRITNECSITIAVKFVCLRIN